MTSIHSHGPEDDDDLDDSDDAFSRQDDDDSDDFFRLLRPISLIDKDMRQAAKTLNLGEVRFLVDMYYRLQLARIAASHQSRILNKKDIPVRLLEYVHSQSALIETELKKALSAYSVNHPIGVWLRSLKGVGPVIACGILSNVDTIARFRNVGRLWAYAGMSVKEVQDAKGNPVAVADGRTKGKKIHYNPQLKRLSYLIGASFQKLKDKDAYYARIYHERLAYEIRKNDEFAYRNQAFHTLKTKDIRNADVREVYEMGKLPVGRLKLRSMRYATKRLYSHLFHVWWGTLTPEERAAAPEPQKPWIFEMGGHTHYDLPPNWDENAKKVVLPRVKIKATGETIAGRPDAEVTGKA